jgi:hypothetical protein
MSDDLAIFLKTSWWILLMPAVTAAAIVIGHIWDQSRNQGRPRPSAKPPRPAGHMYSIVDRIYYIDIKNILFRLLVIIIIGISIIPLWSRLERWEIKAGYSDTSTNNHWLNSNSGVRHNTSCRWYGKTVRGRSSGSSAGRACKTCGG